MIKTLPNPSIDLLNRVCSCFFIVLIDCRLRDDYNRFAALQHLCSYLRSDVGGESPLDEAFGEVSDQAFCYVPSYSQPTFMVFLQGA